MPKITDKNDVKTQAYLGGEDALVITAGGKLARVPFETLRSDTINYQTKADMDEAGGPANGQMAKVWNDPAEENNGEYGWNGSAWEKSKYDVVGRVETLAGHKIDTDEKFEAINAMLEYISGVIVGANGWRMTFRDSISPELTTTISVNRKGFNEQAQSVNVSDTVNVMARIRKPYPEESTLEDLTFYFDEHIYAKDKTTTVFNRSTLEYPAPLCMWVNHDLDIANSSTYTAKLAVAHKFGRNGKPVAAVKFIATDETGNTAETLVSTMSAESFPVSGLSAPVFSGDMDFSGLVQGEMVTIDVVVYPWIGEKFQASINGESYPTNNFSVFKVLNDKEGTYGTAYAYVSNTGDDGTAVVSESTATAQASPFATVSAAAQAIKTFNNSNYGRNNASGGVIRLEPGTHVHGNYSSVEGGPVPLIIESVSGSYSDTFYTDAGSSTNGGTPEFLKLSNLTIRQTANNIIMLDSGAGTNQDGVLVLSACDLDRNGNAVYGAFFYKVGRLYLVGVSGDNLGQSTSFGSVKKQVNAIGCSVDKCLDTSTYHAIGCKALDGRFLGIEEAGERADDKGKFIGWCHVGNGVNSSKCLAISSENEGSGVAAVGSVFEQYGGTTGAAFWIGADGNLSQFKNVVVAHSTIVGSRTNFLYNDSGDIAVEKFGQMHATVHDEYNTKSDVFSPTEGQSGQRVGNWSVIHKVGFQCNSYLRGASNTDAAGVGSWLGEILSVTENTGTDATPLNADWQDDQSFTVGGGGNGTYIPGAASEIVTVPAEKLHYAIDLYGRSAAQDGSDHAGAAF